MTTTQLIKWAKDAQAKRENSYREVKVIETDHVDSFYECSIKEAIDSTFPFMVSMLKDYEIERELVQHLMATWHTELDEIEI